MQEHYLLPDGKPSSVLSYDDVAEDVIEDVQIQFNESKRAVVTVRNFHPRPVASQRTTGATTMTSSRTGLGKIDSGRAERGPIGSKAQVASSSLVSSSAAAAAAGRMSERPQVPVSQQPIRDHRPSPPQTSFRRQKTSLVDSHSDANWPNNPSEGSMLTRFKSLVESLDDPLVMELHIPAAST